MEIKFRISPARFRHEVAQAWPAGVVGATTNKATYSHLLLLVRRHVAILPRARLPPVGPTVSPEARQPSKRAVDLQRRLYFRKAGQRKTMLMEKRRTVLKLLLLGRFTSRSIVQTVGVSWGQLRYVQRLAKTEKGRRHLLEDSASSGRAWITVGHRRALRSMCVGGGQTIPSCWRLK